MDFIVNPAEGHGNTVDFLIDQGETFGFAFAGLADECDDFINLTGYRFEIQIDFPTPALLTTENGGVAYVYPWGYARVPCSVTADLPPGSYSYKQWKIDPDGNRELMMPGYVDVGLTTSSIQ